MVDVLLDLDPKVYDVFTGRRWTDWELANAREWQTMRPCWYDSEVCGTCRGSC